MNCMKSIYFLSDAHLGSLAIPHARTQERRLVNFLDSIKHKAAAVYLLGDMFDFWHEYRYTVPKGFTRLLGKISELTDLGVEVHYFIGNHDLWQHDYFERECGMTLHRHAATLELYGQTFFLAHGDGLGDESRSFRMLRAFFRNRFCQRLYAGIHPRWTVPFALNWSRSNRVNGEDRPFGCDEPLQRFVTNYKEDQKIDYFVFGHRHVAVDKSIGNNSRLIILGDWIKLYSYAVYDGNDLRLQFFTV